MHTLSMIDASKKAFEATAPSKPNEAKRQEFGKVLKKQEPRTERTERTEQPKQAERTEQPKQAERTEQPKQAERTEQPKQAERTEQPEKAAASKEVVEQQPVHEAKAMQRKEPAEQPAAEGKTAEQAEAGEKLQAQVLDLLKMIAGGESADKIETQLKELVQQLENSDLHGEQVVAGVDLSALVEQLQSLADGETGEAQLAQLVSAMEQQLNSQTDLLAGAELMVATMPGVNPQVSSQHLTENLQQARQILQKAVDAVGEQNRSSEQEVLVAEEETADPNLLGKEAGEEKIDPRFANLLKPRAAQTESLRERVQGNQAKPAILERQAPSEATQTEVAVNPEQAVEKIADLLANSPQAKSQNQFQPLQQGNVQQQPQVASERTMPTTAPTVQLPSGQQVAESQIFDQVVTRMSGSFNGESGKMVLRLQPAELGSLKLELMVEGDKVRANLLAQTQQVQEVLERNLPQLRNALAEQGLKIDHFQVDVDQRQEQQGQFDHLAQQQNKQNRSQQKVWQPDWQAEEQIVPLAHLMQNGGGGISLHV